MAGSYHGVRVQINGSSGRSIDVKSAKLQNKQIFDGKDYSVFKNLKGMKISRDPESGLTVFDITSDSATFDIDSSFEVKSVPVTALKYTSAVLFAVLFLSIILLLSVFGKSDRQTAASRTTEFSSSVGTRIGKSTENCGASLTRVHPDVRKGSSTGIRASALRAVVVALVFAMLFLVLSVCGQLFLYNEFSVSSGDSESDSFMIEVSDSPDFSNSAGSTSFYNVRDTQIRIPRRFSSSRITEMTANGAESSFRINSSSGRCLIKNGRIESAGSLSCSADSDGRMYVDFSSTANTAVNILICALAALAVAAVMYFAFSCIEFNAALRLMLIFIMISAYVTGEICMNVESDNVLFYRNYLQLLPDVVLRNICLILFIFLLAELPYSRGFISSGSFLLVLLVTIVYIAVDWGVFKNFGVRPDIRTMISHSDADNSTFLTFIWAFFRTSHASWMVVVMLADWLVMLLSFRRRESNSLRKYLLLLLVINCIPFLKVYKSLYTESNYELRKDIFDIQSDYLAESKNRYTEDFPEYNWKPKYQVIDGLNRRKNVVILLVESLADAYSSYFSGLRGYTPNFDRLAEQNASFLNYHSTGMETAPATYSLMTGKIFFAELDRDFPDFAFEYDDALPKVMKAEGYTTSAIYSSEDFGGRVIIYRRSGFDYRYDTNDPFYKNEKRYVFNSVAD